MKNKIDDLNNHLFAQLERLGDETLTNEQLEIEQKRAKAITDVAGKLIDSANTSLKHTQLIVEYGGEPIGVKMPKLLGNSE